MAKIDLGVVKQWQDGETIHGPEYSNERNLIIQAGNDTQDQVNALKGSGSISTAMLQSKSVTTDKLGDASVTDVKIANGSVTNGKIASGSVTSDKMAANSVQTGSLVDSAVTEAKISSAAVTEAKLADSSVTTNKISNFSVTVSKLANGSVSNDKLADSSVTDVKLASGSVTTTRLSDNAVTSSKLAEGSVTESKVVKGAVTQYSYDKAETDSRIAAATSGGIPESVQDEIRQDILGTFESRFSSDLRSDVTLKRGAQVVTATKSSQFNIGMIEGVTNINQTAASGQGSGVTSGRWVPSGPSVLSGVNNSIKFTCTSGGPSFGAKLPVTIRNDANYILIANVTGFNPVRVSLMDGSASTTYAERVAGSGWVAVRVPSRNNPSSETSIANIFVGSTSSVTGMEGYLKSVSLIPISTAEYDRLANVSSDDIAKQYHLFPQIGPIGVKDPYIYSVSNNMLPSLYEWSTYAAGTSSASVKSGQEVVLTTTAADMCLMQYDFTLVPNTEYSLSAEHNGYINVTSIDLNSSIVGNTAAQKVTFNSGNATLGRVFLSNVNALGQNQIGTFTFKNPSITFGSGDKPYKSRTDSLAVIKTELHANPIDGSDPDTLVQHNKQMYKIKRWERLRLDGSLTYSLGSNPTAGTKKVTVQLPITGVGGVASSRKYVHMTNIFGERLPINSSVILSDTAYLGSSGNPLAFAVSNTLTGWGDSYNPTADEIKAFFGGWKMVVAGQPVGASTYNGSGTKGWISIALALGVPNTTATSYTVTPPTEEATWNDTDIGRYEILYRLANDVVEPVVVDGSLYLSEGVNYVEVGTGAVVREVTRPAKINDPFYVINSIEAAEKYNPLREKVGRFHAVYRDDKKIFPAELANTFAAYGNYRAVIYNWQYSSDSVYAVTYFKLEKTPTPSTVLGTLSGNEKAQIVGMMYDVADISRRVSLIENEKSDKDAPPWVVPTLYNNWTPKLGFAYRVNNGYLEFRGAIGNGLGTIGKLMVLPKYARIKRGATTIALTSVSGATVDPVCIDILADGALNLFTPTNSTIIFENVRIPLD